MTRIHWRIARMVNHKWGAFNSLDIDGWYFPLEFDSFQEARQYVWDKLKEWEDV